MVSNSAPTSASPSALSSTANAPLEVTAPSDSQLLQIDLADTGMLLPVTQLVEILTVATGEVIPVFHLPAWISGVYNWRGEILWIVDLSHLLGLTPWYQQPEYGAKHTVVVLDQTHSQQLRREERSPLGLIVNGVEGMVIGNTQALSHTPIVGRSITLAEAARFIQGYWAESGYPILDGDAVIAAMP